MSDIKIIQEEVDHLSQKINALQGLIERHIKTDSELKEYVRCVDPSSHELARILLSLPDIPVGCFDSGICMSIECLAVKENTLAGVTLESENIPDVKPEKMIVLYSDLHEYEEE